MKTEKMSDSELVKNCLQGDMEAYRQIMDKYKGKAMALAQNMLRNRKMLKMSARKLLSAPFKIWISLICRGVLETGFTL